MPDDATFMKPSAELLRTAEQLRAQGRVVEAGKYGFAAYMHASTRGEEASPHGKLLLPQYHLTQPDADKAMLLWLDGMKQDARETEQFTTWFNEEIQMGGHGAEKAEIGDFDLAWGRIKAAIEQGDLQELRLQVSFGTDLNKLGRNGSLLELACVHNKPEAVGWCGPRATERARQHCGA